jgi:mono/diheme cytochrome c family protein
MNWKLGFAGLIIFMFFNVPSAKSIELTDSPECPQIRKNIPMAPDKFQEKSNLLEKTSQNLEKGKRLYLELARPLQCVFCHGKKGNGLGEMAPESFPNPRNFTCSKTMDNISDGQLFWAIKNGVPKTSMPPFDELSETQIWQLIHYVREFSVRN